MKQRYATCGTICCLILGLMAFCRPVAAQYTINGAQTYQVINGFGANLNHRSWNNDELKPVLDALIGQAGFSIFRVAFDNSDWMTTNNPSQAYLNSVYGSARFGKLWDLVSYLNQKGITTNGVMFNFQGPGADWMGGYNLSPGNESQWAQMIGSALAYARNTRHLQFNLVAPDNEPDIGYQLVGVGATPSQYVTMLNQLALNLNNNGMSDVRFVGPDLAITSTSWLQQMNGNALVMSKLAHFGLHSYLENGNGSSGVSSFIASSAYPGSTFWMTEFNNDCGPCYSSYYDPATYGWDFCSGTAQKLIYHLANGASGGLVWEGYDSYFQLLPLAWLPHGQQAAGWSFFGLFGVDDTNAVPKTYTPRKNFYTVSQISAFVPPGAQRIGVTGAQNSSFMMLAFYHAASGRVTLVGFNTGGALTLPVHLQSLPAVPGFDLYYTDPNVSLKQSATFPVVNGNFTATVPSNCIFTLTGFDPARIAVSVQVTSPTNGSSYAAPVDIPLQAVASTTTGSISNLQFFSGASGLGGSSNASCSILWSNVAPGTYTIAASAADTTGHTNASSNITFTVTGSPAQILLTPTNAIVLTNDGQQFTASVVDALANPIIPQPAVTWQANGGYINPGGWLMAGSNTGGLFTVVASTGGLSSSVNHIITNSINLAPQGIGYIWYNLSSNLANTPQSESPAINDGDLTSSVSLLAEYDGSSDVSNAFEAAGVIWPASQTVSNVVFINGIAAGGNGTFNSGFQLQFTTNGSKWFPAGSSWTVKPAYSYNSSPGSPVPYVFSGNPMTVLGFRCAGQVNTSHSRPAFAYATEVQAFASIAAPPQFQATRTNDRVTISWASTLTNCVLQTSTNNMMPPWTDMTNALQYNGARTGVVIDPARGYGLYRLHFP